MARKPIARCCALIGALAALIPAVATDQARAGEFVVGNCQADPLSFGTRAFEDVLIAPEEPMQVRRADLDQPRTLDRLHAELRRAFELAGGVQHRNTRGF